MHVGERYVETGLWIRSFLNPDLPGLDEGLPAAAMACARQAGSLSLMEFISLGTHDPVALFVSSKHV